MGLAQLVNKMTPYTSKIVAFAGLNRTQELSSTTVSSGEVGSNEQAQMIDGCDVMIDVNGNLVPRPRRANVDLPQGCMGIYSAIECMDYTNGRRDVIAIIDLYGRFFFGDNKWYSQDDIRKQTEGRSIKQNRMVAVNTKLCFIPSMVYFDLTTLSFGTLDVAITIDDVMSLELGEDGTHIEIENPSKAGLLDNIKRGDVIDLEWKNNGTLNDKGESFTDDRGEEYLKIAPDDAKYSTISTAFDGKAYVPRVKGSKDRGLRFVGTESQKAAFDDLMFSCYEDFDEFIVYTEEYAGIGTMVALEWFLRGKSVKYSLVPVAEFLSTYGFEG